MPIKVAVVSVDNSEIKKVGGKHVHQNLLVRGLNELGVYVKTFYLPANLIPSNFLRKALFAIQHPVAVFSIEHRYILHLTILLKYFEMQDFFSFDIVHAHDVVGACKISHEKLILTVHGYFAMESLNYMGNGVSDKTRTKIYDFCLNIEKEAVMKAKHIIAVDTRIGNYLKNEFGVPSDKITVMYNAVDTETFSPVSDEIVKKLRQELGLPEKAFIVLVPRRYVDKNGVIYAARAFERMKDEKYFFVFAGGGPLKKEIEDILKWNRNVLIMDGVPNERIVKYYQASDVVLVPSITSKEGVEEATSLSMLEGMACGKVVICTNVGGMKEVIRNMENGILIEQKNPQAIIDAIEYARRDYISLFELRRRAREYVEKNHSYIEHAKKVLEIYKMLCR